MKLAFHQYFRKLISPLQADGVSWWIIYFLFRRERWGIYPIEIKKSQSLILSWVWIILNGSQIHTNLFHIQIKTNLNGCDQMLQKCLR